MTKLDKSLYTKDEYKRLKKSILDQRSSTVQSSCSNVSYNVLCLKHGDKYNSDYVNKLYYGVTKNTTLPCKFFCLTDNAENLDKNIIALPLPNYNLAGWWFKPYIFSKELPITGFVLYIDLDVVITNNIDKLFKYNINCFNIVRDFNRVLRPSYDRFNSSVMSFTAGSLDYLWQKFSMQHQFIVKSNHGDQDFIFKEQKSFAKFFPDSWIQSWKWEIRKDRKLATGNRGYRKLQKIEDVRPPEECCIAVFHGDPNPHLCDDPYIKETWIYKE